MDVRYCASARLLVARVFLAGPMDDFLTPELEAGAAPLAPVARRFGADSRGRSLFHDLGAGCHRIFHVFYTPGVLHNSGRSGTGFI